MKDIIEGIIKTKKNTTKRGVNSKLIDVPIYKDIKGNSILIIANFP